MNMLPTTPLERPLILIADDESKIRRILALNLEKHGYDVMMAVDGKHAVELFEKAQPKPDLLLLDYMMPELDGIDVIRHVRMTSDVPAIMLTAKDNVHTKVESFESGMDDYITKPFAFEELLVRIKAILRRRPSRTTDQKENSRIEILQNGPLALDLSKRECSWNEEGEGKKLINLTQTEFKLMEMLLRRPGCVFSHEEIILKLWECVDENSQNALRVTISRLRKKFVSAGIETTFISTHAGYGYTLADLSDWD